MEQRSQQRLFAAEPARCGVEVVPAIDIRGGKCVRLFQGDYGKETVFSEDPVSVALEFVSAGADTLHVVDLDGALVGRPVNLNIVREIAKASDARVELGGGLRSLEDLEAAFEAGAARAIVGTSAARDLEFARAVCEEFGDRVMAAIDVRNGRVAVHGWTVDTAVTARYFARALAQAGMTHAIVTDIRRDGAMKGPNLEPALEVAAEGVNVTVSGGISTLMHVRDVVSAAAEEPRILAMIIGRSLYTGHLTLAEAIRATVEDHPCWQKE
ncbi:MAG: HisA/HisF-related TIM barrel protein [Firmicutes bacterium]|nr:HisA/HisF-related TIM barrel protein [Bacillota bacterium]